MSSLFVLRSSPSERGTRSYERSWGGTGTPALASNSPGFLGVPHGRLGLPEPTKEYKHEIYLDGLCSNWRLIADRIARFNRCWPKHGRRDANGESSHGIASSANTNDDRH